MEIWIHTKEMKAARNGKYTGKKKKIFFFSHFKVL